MSTLPKLITAFSELDGRDHATLTQFGRVIREAGYIPAGKRGAGAPKMTAEHVTNLLLGIYGSAAQKDAPYRLAALKALERYAPDDNAPMPLKEVQKAATFGDAIEELLKAVPLILDDAIAAFDGKHDAATVKRLMTKGVGPMRLIVTIKTAGATIKYLNAQGQTTFDAEFITPDEQVFTDTYRDAVQFDRRVEVKFGFRTFWTLLNAFSETRTST